MKRHIQNFNEVAVIFMGTLIFTIIIIIIIIINYLPFSTKRFYVEGARIKLPSNRSKVWHNLEMCEGKSYENRR